MSFQIELTEAAEAALKKLSDKRIQKEIVTRILKLKEDPDKQGKALVGNLQGYRSVRAVGQRYRIIYRLESDRVLVLVVLLGLRKDGDKKDIYALAKKLLKTGLIAVGSVPEEAH